MKYNFNFKITKLPRKTLSAPIILAMIVPLVILDVCIEIYHQTTFRLLKIPVVNRWDYIRIDRHKLSYLSLIRKIFCMYCGYANGLLQYSAKIAAESEKHWCGIMHKTNKDDSFVVPNHHKNFLKYGDEEAYKKEILSSKK